MIIDVRKKLVVSMCWSRTTTITPKQNSEA